MPSRAELQRERHDQLPPLLRVITDAQGNEFQDLRRPLRALAQDLRADTEEGFARLEIVLAGLEYERGILAMRQLHALGSWAKGRCNSEVRGHIEADIRAGERKLYMAHLMYERAQARYSAFKAKARRAAT